MNISKSTIIRTVAVVIVAINIILERFGVDVIPTDESKIAMFVEVFLEVATIIVAWWKNNSFSPNAIKADKFLKQLKADEGEVEEYETY